MSAEKSLPSPDSVRFASARLGQADYSRAACYEHLLMNRDIAHLWWISPVSALTTTCVPAWRREQLGRSAASPVKQNAAILRKPDPLDGRCMLHKQFR